MQITYNGSFATATGFSRELLARLLISFPLTLEPEFWEAFSLKSRLPLTPRLPLVYMGRVERGALIFPTGLLPALLTKLSKQGLEPELIKQVGVAKLSGLPPNPLLRPDQLEFYQKALAARRGMVEAPTSMGKSWVLGELLRQFVPDTPRLLLVPTVRLLYQMQRDLSAYLQLPLEEIGLVGDGKFKLKPITVAIPDTLASKLLRQDELTQNYLASVLVLLADEVHEYANPTMAVVSDALINTQYRLGCSATLNIELLPLLEAFLGPVLFRFKAADKIADGTIMKPKLLFYPAPKGRTSPYLVNYQWRNWKDPRTLKAYNNIYNDLIVLNSGRNQLAAAWVAEDIKRADGPVLILVKRVGTTKKKDKQGNELETISHARIFQELLATKYNVTLPIVDGSVKGKQVEAILQQLEDFTIPGLIASEKILSVGVSIKSITSLILLCGGSQEKDFVQRVGRVLRFKEGKPQPLVRDFLDQQSLFAGQSLKRLGYAKDIYPGCVSVFDHEGKAVHGN